MNSTLCLYTESEYSNRLWVVSNEMHFKLERTSHIASWCLLRCVCVVNDGMCTHTRAHTDTQIIIIIILCPYHNTYTLQ